MNPQVEAALIAGIVSIISLGGTVVVALRGFHATTQTTDKMATEAHKDTADTLAAQREQLDRTLAAQREQLDRTLAEQREQLDSTLAEQHARTLNERFATAAEKLGADKAPAVRLAGVYAMAGLADDWPENRQTCIEVLCGYLRMPYAADPGDGKDRLGFLADREVRHTVISVITAHLRMGATASWQGMHFDLTGVVFDGGNFFVARFSEGTVVSFDNAEFSGGEVSFLGARFNGGKVSFEHARFTGGQVSFYSAEFSGGEVSFLGTEFSGGTVIFRTAQFSGGRITFYNARFSGSTVIFAGARFSATVSFLPVADWSHPPVFDRGETPPSGVRLNSSQWQAFLDSPEYHGL